MTFSLYGLIIGLSFLLGWAIVERVLPKDPKVSWDAGAVCLFIFGILGARIYHLATDWNLYNGAPPLALLAVWNGGLGLYGGLLGGALGLFVWWKLSKPRWQLLQFLDALALALPWSQALGRLGNFFNQELFGPPTNLPWGIYIEPSYRPDIFINATHFHPLFLYEALGSITLGSLLWFVYKKHPQSLGTGKLLGLYGIGYGTLRFSLEFLRLNSAPGLLGLTVAQNISLALVLVGLTLITRRPLQ